MPPNELAPRADLQNLLDAALRVGGETSAFDFKEQLDIQRDDHKIRLVKAIGAFANTDAGGHIWIGISDSRQVVGVADNIAALYDQTRIQGIANSFLAPPPEVQVRHGERGGKRVVAIEVSPFKEVPCIVKESRSAGGEKLVAGTVLFRNAAAESAVLRAEGDMRKLCDAIVARRATGLVELIQKGLVGVAPPRVDFALAQRAPPRPAGEAAVARLNALRDRAQSYWSVAPGERPFIEVSFAPDVDLRLGREELRTLIPRACVPGQHGFPFFYVSGGDVYQLQPWGWLGAIPFSEQPNPDLKLGYLWMLDRSGAFLYREHFWEEDPRSVIPGGVGLFHVLGNIIRLVRFLDRFGRALPDAVTESTDFVVSTVLNNVKDRYLEDERGTSLPPLRRATIPEARVEAQLVTSLGAVRASREEAVVNLLEEVVWQCRRDDWSRQKLVEAVPRAAQFLGAEYALPPEESVPGVAQS